MSQEVAGLPKLPCFNKVSEEEVPGAKRHN